MKIKENKILFIGFKQYNALDKESTEELIKQLKGQDTFLFSNDYTRVIYEIDALAENKKYDYIIIFRHIKGLEQLLLETKCKYKKDIMPTNFPLNKLQQILEENDIAYQISENIIINYCNFAYYNLLKCFEVRKINTKVLLIHTPPIYAYKQIDKLVELINRK